jgi:mono/diheme cytochrome c family protein
VGLALGIAWVAFAGESKMPPEYAKKKNTVKATPQSIAAGKKLYDTKCASCHGKTGKGDGEMIKQMPNVKVPDMTTAEFAKESEQEIFWIMSEGKPGTVMMAFKTDKAFAKDNDRWHVVNFIKSLAPKKK